MSKARPSITLHNRAEEAYALFAGHLLKHTLPSAWGKQGCGWQQLWTSKYAGFYASCDGIILLNHLPVGHPLRASAERLVEHVLHEHLCPIIDDHCKPETAAQRGNRRDAANTTMKLAKFVQATNTGIARARRLLPEKLVAQARQQLEQARSHGGWPPSFGVKAPRPCAFATGEALRAIAPWGVKCSSFRDGAAFLASYLNLNGKTVDTTGKELVAIWALSSLLPDRKQHSSTATARLRFYLGQSYMHEHQRPQIHFNVDSTGTADYYSFNATYIGATAALNLMRNDLLSVSALSAVADAVVHAVENLNDFVARWPETRTNEHLFWEQAQAAALLAAFIDSADISSKVKEYNPMQITPTHFHVQRFVVQNDHAVILMPFREPWSNDIYKAFCDAVEAKNFHAWRSDNEFGDDNIMQTIWAQINKARFIIADCTGRNPNVFYELGIAHTVGKPAFICAQKREDIPFDIGAIRSFTYGTIPSEVKKLKAAVKRFIEAL